MTSDELHVGSITRGESWSLRVALETTPGGAPLDLSGWTPVVPEVRRFPGATELLAFMGATVNAPAGEVDLTLGAAVTVGLPLGTVHSDLIMQDPGGNPQRMLRITAIVND